MERLIRNQMLYGGLLPISQPHQVERYNTALEAFGLPRTKLKEFSIDAVGFSPEVAIDIGPDRTTLMVGAPFTNNGGNTDECIPINNLTAGDIHDDRTLTHLRKRPFINDVFCFWR